MNELIDIYSTPRVLRQSATETCVSQEILFLGDVEEAVPGIKYPVP